MSKRVAATGTSCATAVTPELAVLRDVMVPARDGVRLATDVYLPARDGAALPGPFPLILERTPYDKRADSRSERIAGDARLRTRAEVAAFFTRHGFAVAYQDCRGRYGSEGVFTKYLGEATDGYDAVEWLAAQPWCSGRVGTMGLSYAAHTQGALACLNPPHLACMFLDSGGFSNAYQGGIRQGGAFELKQLTWAFKNAPLSPAAQADPLARAALEHEDLRAWFRHLPWRAGHSPLRWVPEYEDYVLEQWQHGTFDEFWKQPGIYALGFVDRYADVPMVHMSSWYDPYPRTVTDNFQALSRTKSGPVKLILGPWIHGARSVTWAGDVDFGPAATLDGQLAESFLHLRLAWFQRWLLPEGARGEDPDPPVRLFVMGGGSGRRNAAGRLEHGGRWITAQDWPLPGTDFQPWHFHGRGALAPESPAAEALALDWQHDPAHPVPTIGGAVTSGAPLMEGGAFDQRGDARFYPCEPPFLPLAARADVLVFQTAPLERPITVAGPLRARLWIASDAPDTDFTAKLIDVHPPNADFPQGFAMNLAHGILRARYRNSWEHPELMTPWQIYEVVVELFPTANRFMPGHRIRVDIASSNFPHFDVNPNTGEPEGQSRTTRIATNRLYVDAARPSHIVLPVIEDDGM